MKEYNTQKYLGMAVHFMYYYFSDLKGEKNHYEDSICKSLKTKRNPPKKSDSLN